MSWREAIEKSNYYHKSFEEIESCVEKHANHDDLHHVDRDDVKLFFTSIHALYMYQKDYLSYSNYVSMASELKLFEESLIRRLDRLALTRWPQHLKPMGHLCRNYRSKIKCGSSRYSKLKCKIQCVGDGDGLANGYSKFDLQTSNP